MQIPSNNFTQLGNKPKNQPSFSGAKTPSVDSLRKISKVVDCKFGHLASDLADKVKKYAPDMLDDIGGGVSRVKNRPRYFNFKESLAYPFVEGLSKLLPNCKANFLKEHRIYQENKIYERAARGMYEYGADFIEKSKGKQILANCGEFCNNICKPIEDGFYSKFAKNLASDSPQYGSREERSLARLVTGLIPAVFLGIDFKNKAIRDGATGEEANKEANKKRTQEVIANVGESYAQFVMLGGFPSFINNSQMGAPLINTGLGLSFNVISRLIQGMPLTKIKIPQKPKSLNVSMEDFINRVKNPQIENNVNSLKGAVETTPHTPACGQNEVATYKAGCSKSKRKEPLLSLKNIALACLVSVGVGMALKFGKKGLSKTPVGEFFEKKANSFKSWFNKYTMEELFVSQDDLRPFYEALDITGNSKTYQHYFEILETAFKNTSKNGKLSLGKYEKTINILGQELTIKELCKIPLAPFKLIAEIVSYPYKAVNTILTQANVKGFKKAAGKDGDILYNGAGNFVKDFQKHAEMFKNKGKSGQEFMDFYKKHLEKNVLQTLDREGNSKVDNARMGKLTQLLGTVASIYFATTDDFNRTAKRTGNKDLAERDARERGVNKFMRIVTQLALIDIFNKTFKIPYAQSILGTIGVNVGCTFATEYVSRGLSGMPSFEVKNKEEYDKYKKEHKEGALKGYYNVLDRLAE